MNPALGRVLYGTLFCVVLPALLILWAQYTDERIGWPVHGAGWVEAGMVVAVVGAALVVKAMLDLWRYGKGLPMNAYPPQDFVKRGAYALFRHPIYVGASMCCLGSALFFGSPSGLYLVTPVFILCCWALVHGYEDDAIRERFGTPAHRVLFEPPPDGELGASLVERLVVALLVFGPWILLYEWLIFKGPDPRAVDTFMSWERGLTVIPWAEPLYAATYVFAGLVPLLMRTRRQLRAFAWDALWAVALGLFLQAVLPFKAEPIPVPSDGGCWSRMILWERSQDGPAAAFPSFHVLWAFIAAAAYGRRWSAARPVFLVFAVAIAWSCSATGAHSVLDIVAGFALFLFIQRRSGIAAAARSISERLANSARAWRIGPVRIISHAWFSGLAGAVLALASAAFGADKRVILLVATCGLVGAALWGQYIEGSPRLLRPFGFYGSVIGVVAGAFVAHAVFGAGVVNTLTILALSAPWMQSVGRLRCLVQGCCHGRPIGDAAQGIRYTNPRSRVCSISGMAGIPLHNTQGYSMMAGVVIGLVLWRMAWSGAEQTLIMGVYLMLGGLARFVEEHYRGESQTPVRGGLRLYQWVAIASVVAGAVLTCFPSAPFVLRPNWDDALVFALIGGVVAALAMSVDLPRGKMRFSRLSG